VSAPLVVNTKDGTCWTRRMVTTSGLALYAPEGVCKCPEFVMATLAELAEHGIVGSADALPVPVGAEPQPLSEVDELAAFRALDLGVPDGRVSASCGKPDHPTWLRKVDDTRACPWCVMDLQNDSLVARTHQLAHYEETERNFWANQRADQSLAAVANRRIAELNQERDGLQSRVAELEKQREALTERLRAGQTWQRGRNPELVSEDLVSQSELRAIFGIPLVAPWNDATEDLCHPCGCPKRFDRHADGFPAPDADSTNQLVEWCTGCNTDHNPDQCGYRPEAGDR